jgi:ribosomal protein S18 acetylase RimI-like enzyme
VVGIGPQDDAWTRAALEQAWGSVHVARKGELLDASELPGFVAVLEGKRVGIVLVAVRGQQYEVVSISAMVENKGVGRALMQRCFDDANRKGCRRVWLTTTNNNVRAFAFYQHLGMDLCALHRHAVAAARRLKPSIPERDAFGVAIDHELEFELLLEQPPRA